MNNSPSAIATDANNVILLSITANNSVQPEGNNGIKPFTFTINRTGNLGGTNAVNWAITPSNRNPVDINDFSVNQNFTSEKDNNSEDAKGELPPYVPQQMIVKLKPGVNPSQVDEFKQSLGVANTKVIHLTGSEIWQLSENTTVEIVLNTYADSPLFEYMEPDYILSTSAQIPNDPDFSRLWALNNTGQGGITPDADIDAPEAWDIQTGNPNFVIAVTDTGIDYNHPDLAANIWTNPGEIPGDGIDNDGNGYIDDVKGWDFAYGDNNPMDVDGHGTHVAGTIAGQGNNGVGITGVAWGAKLMPLKFLNDSGFGSTSNAILAINYATAKGAKLINSSWGSSSYSQGLYDAMNAAAQLGVLFIAAAGNSGTSNDIIPHYPASYNLDNIISVASTTSTDRLSFFSNYGQSSVDLAAPGSSIYSTLPGGIYGVKSGTSMATPHVTGAAALLWSENPHWTARQVKNVLIGTGDRIPDLNGITVSGLRLNLHSALSNPPMVTARVNVTPSSVDEDGSQNLAYIFTRSNESLDSSLTVNFSASGTASYGSDYIVIYNDNITFNSVTKIGTVTFPPGVSALQLVVDPLEDIVSEVANESVNVTINSGVGYLISSPASATGIIVSDESLPIFSNPNRISIPALGNSNPYPSIISVSGVNGSITNLTVTLNNLEHTYPDDLDILLVGPTGAKVVLMSDVGAGFNVSNTTLTFSASATAYLPNNAQITSGVYLPTDFQPEDSFVDPAPGGSYSTDLSTFRNTNANGDWSLYVIDDTDIDSGAIISGWSLLLEIQPNLPSGSVTFEPGETTKSIAVYVNGDTVVESNEKFNITLSNPTNGAAISDATVTGEIENDDFEGIGAIKITDSFEDDDDQFIRFSTPLSQFRAGVEDSDLVRAGYPDSRQFVDLKNNGRVNLVITNIQVRTEDIILDDEFDNEYSIIIAPGATQRINFSYQPTNAGTDFDRDDGLVIFTNLGEVEIGLAGKSTFDADVDYDGFVGFSDLGPLNTNWNTSTINPNWDSTCDINGDGFISIADLGALNRDWGASIL